MKTLSHFLPVAALPAAGINPWRRFATVTVTETKGFWRWKRSVRYTAGIVQQIHAAAPWRFTETEEAVPAGQVEALIQVYLGRCPKGSFFTGQGV